MLVIPYLEKVGYNNNHTNMCVVTSNKSQDIYSEVYATYLYQYSINTVWTT